MNEEEKQGTKNQETNKTSLKQVLFVFLLVTATIFLIIGLVNLFPHFYGRFHFFMQNVAFILISAFLFSFAARLSTISEFLKEEEQDNELDWKKVLSFFLIILGIILLIVGLIKFYPSNHYSGEEYDDLVIKGFSLISTATVAGALTTLLK